MPRQRKYTKLQIETLQEHDALYEHKTGTEMVCPDGIHGMGTHYNISHTQRSDATLVPKQLREQYIYTQITGMNPNEWNANQVQTWLKRNGLNSLTNLRVLSDIDGAHLMQLHTDDFRKYYLKKSHIADKPKIERFFRELARLQLIADKYVKHHETTLYDVTEIKRRIETFKDKWDSILWIKHYEEINNMVPDIETIALELGLSNQLATIYLEHYEHIDRYRKKDLDELFCNFDVYNDCIIWWYLIMNKLKTAPSKSLWLIFARVALITPHKVSMGLMAQYQKDLTRFHATDLMMVTNNIVIGSTHPICTALVVAKWFEDRANMDVARANVFTEAKDIYIKSAINYLSIIDSDHLSTILLESKSDLFGCNALDLALQYKLVNFVADDTVERITTSIMNDWEFLKPENRESSFEINPLCVDLIWTKLWKTYRVFYFTPLGTFITTFFLYIAYLCIFTTLSFTEAGVYDPMGDNETIFWVLNVGYVLHELIELFSDGWAKYFSHTSNWFDAVISIIFMVGLTMRMYCATNGPPCIDPILMNPTPAPTNALGSTRPPYENVNECWYWYPENQIFTILWVAAIVMLYLRILLFCLLSRNLGPMVQIIFNMKNDIITFFFIIICVFLGFVIALMFMMDGIHPGFENFGDATITLFNGLVAGEFDFDDFEPVNKENKALIFIAHVTVVCYLVAAALVLLNVLIAMMAKTFDHIHDDATNTIIFNKFELAYGSDTSTTFMPPPLNVFSAILFTLFYVLEYSVNWVKLFFYQFKRNPSKKFQVFDLALHIMPRWMRRRNLEIDEQIVSKKHIWQIKTNEGLTNCKMTRYDAEKMKHTVRFEDDNGKPMQVSIHPNVERKSEWELDVLQLYKDDLIDLSQFNTEIDQEWLSAAHYDMNSGWLQWVTCSKRVPFNKNYEPRYWICAFCRSHVKESRLSISRLGKALYLNNIEMQTVHKLSPRICPNCYRVRYQRARYQLVAEIISVWIFYLIVGPFLILFFAICVVLNSPIEHWRALRKKIAKAVEGKDGCLHRLLAIYESDMSYCNQYYSQRLNSNLNKESTEDKLFAEDQSCKVWEYLNSAKNGIDPVQLKERIDEHRCHISTDSPLTQYEFLSEFIQLTKLKDNKHDAKEIEKISNAIYKKMADKNKALVPLHLFKAYPFDALSFLDNFHECWINQRREEEEKLQIEDTKRSKSMAHQMPIDLVDLNERQFSEVMAAFYNQRNRICFALNNKERDFLIKSINQSDNYRKHKNIYQKFMKFVGDVSSLVQDNQKIKTLLRDIKIAMDEKGIDLLVCKEELQFLCQDLNEMLVIPIYHSMKYLCNQMHRQKMGSKLFLWDIRNNIIIIDLIQQTVKHELLHKHSTIRISKEKLKQSIFKRFKNIIIDDDDTKNNEEPFDKPLQPKLSRVATQSRLCEEERSDSFDSFSEPAYSRRLQSVVHELVETESNMSPRKRYNGRLLPSEDPINMNAFLKSRVRLSTLCNAIDVIFETMRHQAKISVTSISAYYVHEIIRSEEMLQYIYEQLKRYTAFNQDKLNMNCSDVDLMNILCKLDFSKRYYIDKEMIPRGLSYDDHEHNDHGGIIKELYLHYVAIHKEANGIKELHSPKRVKFSPSPQAIHGLLAKRQVSDMAPLEEVASKLSNKMDKNDDEEEEQDDDDDDVEEDEDIAVESSPFVPSKVQNPASISVQNILQIAMLYDIIHQKVRKELINMTSLNTVDHDIFVKFVDPEFEICANGQKPQNAKGKAASDLFHAVLCTQQNIVSLGQARQTIDRLIKEINDMDCGKIIRVMNHLKSEIQTDLKKITDYEIGQNGLKNQDKNARHPRLNMRHFDDTKWSAFIKKMHNSIHIPCVRNDCKICGRFGDEETLILERRRKNESIDLVNDCNDWLEDQTENVFERVLSFCRDSITIQQLYKFAVKFARFLKANERISALMAAYHKHIRHMSKAHKRTGSLNGLHANSMTVNDNFWDEGEWKNSYSLDDFRREYFEHSEWNFNSKKMNVNIERFKLAINWLYQYSETKLDFCHLINLFWSSKSTHVAHGNMILKIYDFMQSASNMDGSYALSNEEFCLWKLDLGITQESAFRLFYIIRGELRTMSLKQFYHYFQFLLRMKYHVQDAIIKSFQREDTTLTAAGLKIELKVSSDAESEWLFNKINEEHEGMLTWKQISEYLEKTLSLRKNMKDFFHEKNKQRNYEDKEAEIMIKMSEDTQTVLKKLDSLKDDGDDDGIKKLENVMIDHCKKGKMMDCNAFAAVIRFLGIEFSRRHSARIFNDLVMKQRHENSIKMMLIDKTSVDLLISAIKVLVPVRDNLTARQILHMALLKLNQRKERTSSFDSDVSGLSDRGKQDSFDV